MTKHTLYIALLALFVGGSTAVPLAAQAQDEDEQVAHEERAPDQADESVTVRVTNNNWLDMRIYVVETATGRRRFRLGNVTSLSTARFEIPQQVGAELGSLRLVAEPIGSRERLFTDPLQTWPGEFVDWRIESVLSHSAVTIS